MAGKSTIGAQHSRIVVQSAIASRLLLLALIVLWRSFLRPYDTSASINPSCLSSSSSPPPQTLILFPRVASAIEDSIVWDSVYFVRIAECGYEYEQYFAFFPLLPLCISLLSRTVFAPLVPLIGYRAVLGFSGYVVNSIFFVLAAIYLYRLSLIILKDGNGALRASILFCFNPASIFYSSIYTESLYSLLSLGGLYHFTCGENIFATIFFALSGAARSNGVINAGYICYWTMHKGFNAFFCTRHFLSVALVVAAGLCSCICIFTPFIAFQAYGYKNICQGHDPDELSPWCKARLPLLYNYVQSHYWGVGFLRYFELKQLPNFLLASPILSLALGAIIHYVKLSPGSFFSLGFRGSPQDEISAHMSFHTEVALSSKPSSTILLGDRILKQRKQTLKDEGSVILPTRDESFLSSRRSSFLILPVVLHLGFMTATAFFVMYVQVSTRFLSASPAIYWFAAHLIASPGICKRWWGNLIWTYSAAYILLGSLLFSNFYPFT